MVVQKKTHDGGLSGLTARLSKLTRVGVYVGVPAGKASRPRRDGKTELNNAELLYIHTNGSPLRRIPARPVIEPALKANRGKIMEQYNKAVLAASRGNDTELSAALIRTGLAGQNAARDWFTNPRNGWAPNSPLTIARKGSSRPLIDTGTLRKSIIYVVRGR